MQPRAPVASTHAPAKLELFLQIAEDHVALGRVAKRAGDEPFGGLGDGWPGPRLAAAWRHQSSASRPFHSRSRAAREAFSARTAAGVTVK